jgi:fructose/tagatose bisphosphate aldolase
MRQLLDEAAKGGYGVGAFNVNDMEQIQAIMAAAKETKSPVIVQASRGARQFAEDLYLFKLIQAAAELNPDIPIAMHQDHGNSFETCKSAILLGYTSVMMDGSKKHLTGRKRMNTMLLKLYVKFQDLMSREEGQDLVEYALVVALVAFGATVGMKALATGLNTAFTTISSTLSSSLA